VTSNATYDDIAGSQQSNGGVAGAYAALAYAGWRFHVTAKTDFGVTDVSTGSDSDTASYWAPGIAATAGYKHKLTPTSYLHPKATLSYVHRSMGDMSLDGTNIDYDDTESLRGRIGLRLGSFALGETHTIEPWMEANVWHEFLGESKATFSGASGALDFDGLGAGTFAEVSGGVNVTSRTVPGLSGNIRTEVSFGERNLFGLSGRLELAYRFPVK
jgi:outer membrane autotransporter protein